MQFTLLLKWYVVTATDLACSGSTASDSACGIYYESAAMDLFTTLSPATYNDRWRTLESSSIASHGQLQPLRGLSACPLPIGGPRTTNDGPQSLPRLTSAFHAPASSATTLLLSQCSDDPTLISESSAKSGGLVTLRPLVNFLSSLPYN